MMFGLKVPVICVVIGEGGSGGALAIGVANQVLMQEFSTARRLLRNIVRTRRNRRNVLEAASEHPAPAPGSIQIAVYFADTKVNLYQLRQWYDWVLVDGGRPAIVSSSPDWCPTLTRIASAAPSMVATMRWLNASAVSVMFSDATPATRRDPGSTWVNAGCMMYGGEQ